MAEGAAPGSLGDFFAKKKKKVLKGSNLNNEASAAKPEEQKKSKKDKNEDEWEEEQIVETTMQVSVARNLTKDEDTKDDGEDQKAAWGRKDQKSKGETARKDLNEKKFPSLAKSVVGPSSNINIDDGKGGDINIKTSKNVFAALEDEDEADQGPKRPKQIKPAMVTKKQGERAKEAVQREVAKYSAKDEKKSRKKKKKDDSDDEDEEEEEEEEEEEVQQAAKKPAKRDDKKKVKQAKAAPVEEEKGEAAEDVKIVPDEVASRAKYIGRAKLEEVPLRKEELREEKKAAPPASLGKKKKFQGEEDDDKKRNLIVLDD